MSDPLDVTPEDARAAALSRLSHAVRTPLSVIVGYTELLRFRQDEETRREAPERIAEAAEQLSYAVDDLLVVVALDGGVLSLDVGPVDLEGALAATLESLDVPLAGRAVSMRSADGEDLWPEVCGDAEHIERILANLLLAAADRSPEGAAIEVSVHRREGLASVEVADRGSTLTEEQLTHLFDRVAPVKLPDVAGNRRTGLELYKARRLAELQGGSLAAATRDGGGTIVVLTLPLADVASGEARPTVS